MLLITRFADTGERLDRFLARETNLSRAVVKNAIQEGRCVINGETVQKANRLLAPDLEISFDPPSPTPLLQPEEGDFSLLHEDEDILVINKDAGLTVHPCPSCPEGTLLQRLAARYPELLRMDGMRPGIVHRLDKDTSGVLIVCRNEEARKRLSQDFADRRVEKHYFCLVLGNAPDEGDISDPIGRDPRSKVKMAVLAQNAGGRYALTHFQTLWRSPRKDISLLRVTLHTGRTHQIRVHLSHLGYPLLGDQLYGGKEATSRAPRQMLHAADISFFHPVTQEKMHFSVMPPDDFLQTLFQAKKRLRRLVITGNPASGKSTLTRILGRFLPSVSSDALVASLYANEHIVQDWLSLRHIDSLTEKDGVLRKDAFFALLQENPLLRRDLEALIHAIVRERIVEFWEREEKKGEDFAIAEIPLYFECRWQDMHARSICVFAPKEQRYERLLGRSWSEEKISTIESWQWDAQKKADSSDYVIDNAGSLSDLEEKAMALFRKLAEEKKEEERKEEEYLRNLLASR